MELGAFSISLNVKDLEVSKAFYEKLGFEATGGDDKAYLIMANGTTIIGLFVGMFEDNILTFNPGLTNKKEQLKDFTDIRHIRQKLLDAGVEMKVDLDPESNDPAHLVFEDPDGNPIMIDQFFPKPS